MSSDIDMNGCIMSIFRCTWQINLCNQRRSISMSSDSNGGQKSTVTILSEIKISVEKGKAITKGEY